MRNSYQKAVELDISKSDIDECYLNIGNNYTRLKNYEEAIKYYNESIRINPTKLGAYKNMSLTYYFKGNNRRSCEIAKKLSHIDSMGDFGSWARGFLKENECSKY